VVGRPARANWIARAVPQEPAPRTVMGSTVPPRLS
jgi:hypothetical protein